MTRMTTDEFYASIIDIEDADQKIVEAVKADMIFDYIGNEGHTFSKDRLVDIVKELGYAMYDNLRREPDLYNAILNDAATELTERWCLEDD